MENKTGPAVAIALGVLVVWFAVTGKLQNLMRAANTGQPVGAQSPAAPSGTNSSPSQPNGTQVSGTPGPITSSAEPSYLPPFSDANEAWNAAYGQITNAYLKSIGVPSVG